MTHAEKNSKVTTEVVVKIESSRTGGKGKGRRGTPAKVWRVLKQVLDDEQLQVFVSTLPMQLTATAFLSGNPDEVLGKHLLGERLDEYVAAPSYKRRRILAQTLAERIEAAGLPVPEKIQHLTKTTSGKRGPRANSRIVKYQNLLAQTHQLMQDPAYSHIKGYLGEIEGVLQYHIDKLEALKEYIKSKREKQQ